MSIPIDPTKITPELIAKFREEGLIELADQFEKQKQDSRSETDKWLDKFVTIYPEMIAVKNKAKKIALVSDPVLILGESGTGKELFARALHGDRKGRFVAINCAGLPETLVESELFGHVKNAFTGANQEKTGLLEFAKDGTIFLDEIGELPKAMQSKLLRAFQEMSIRKVGGEREIPINCRLVSATHRALEEDILLEDFRSDVFYRISTFILRLLPLRQRRKDIEPIVRALDVDKIIPYERFVPRITDDNLHGNVRSLQQLVRRYYVLGELPNENKLEY